MQHVLQYVYSRSSIRWQKQLNLRKYHLRDVIIYVSGCWTRLAADNNPASES